MRRFLYLMGGGIAGLVLAMVVANAYFPTYISTAVVRVVPAQIADTIVPSAMNAPVEGRITGMTQQILSRSNLTNIVNVLGLYPGERARIPMEDVVERMRKDVHISQVMSVTVGEQQNVCAFQIRFAYRDRLKAQVVAADLARRFIEENSRQRTNMSVQTTQFLKDMTEQAAREWAAVAASNAPPERKASDLAIAKKQYESLKQKMADAKLAEELEKRQQSVNMELLDPASLPQKPAPVSGWVPGGGFTGGFLLSLLVIWMRRKRRTRVTTLHAA